jgi:hypothetical protein
MTWVIGGSTIFGYGVVLSDIRVTCEETGRHWDILQKAHPLGKFIAGGFSGDVGIGISMLRSLQLFLNHDPPARDEYWEPGYVAEKWSKEAQRIYGEIVANGGEGPVDILTVGVSRRDETLGGAVPVVSVLRSPDFVPDTVVGGNQVRSIGSGSDVERYRQALEHLFRTDDVTYLQSEIGSPGGFARLAGNIIMHEATQNPVEGVSRYFHLFIVRLGQIEMMTPNGMPAVARNMPELLERIGAGVDAKALTA